MTRTKGVTATAAAARAKIQFEISPEDESDLDALVGEVRNRTSVALILFLYGLDNSEAAFAAYAKPHQESRRKRKGSTIDAESRADD